MCKSGRAYTLGYQTVRLFVLYLDPGLGHLITFGSTRSGKGAGQIVTNLLNWPGSVVVLDIKGENYLRSAGWRATKLNHQVYRFSPFEAHTDVWNPLLSIRTRLEGEPPLTFNERCQEEEDTRYLANLLIAPSGSQHDRFWEDKAKALLVGLLLHVRTTPLDTHPRDGATDHSVHERSMYEVARLAALETDDFSSLLEDMRKSTRTLIRQVGTSFQGYLAHEGKLGLSIQASLLQHLDVWSYERIRRATYQAAESPGAEPTPNAFEFETLRNGKTSLYLVIPPEYLAEYRAVLRVLVGCGIRQLKESYVSARTQAPLKDQPPVLFLLDEFPQLAYLSPIAEGLAYLAGYDIRLWLFLQDINQLRIHYPDAWGSFLANTEFKCFFGVNDIDTAKLVSEMTGTLNAGDITQLIPGVIRIDPSPLKDFVTGRYLLTPDEVMRMPPTKQMVFGKGLKPMYLDLTPFYRLESQLQKSQIPPPHPINFI